MFPWVCQLLLEIHCTLFHNGDPFYSFDKKRSTFFLGSWSWKCLLIFEGFFHDCPTFDSCRPFQPFVFKTNASNFALGVIVSQPNEDNLFHLVGFVLVKFLLPRLITRFMTNNFWPSWMPLKNGVIYLKELNMKSFCILIKKIFNISWQLVCWINDNFDGAYCCLHFDSWILIVHGNNKGNRMRCHVVRTLCLRRGMSIIINNVT
jgi:hypothetical protein